MASLLLSGPAGAGKSQAARRLRDESPDLTVLADFQSLYAAISGDTRGPDGRFPLRDDRLLPTVEYLRRAVITAAVNRDIDVIATNSDGDPDRRAMLLGQLGAGATERIVDPGREVVAARLSDPETGELSGGVRRSDRALVREEALMFETLIAPLEFRADDTRASPGRITGTLLQYETRARDRAEVFAVGGARLAGGGDLAERPARSGATDHAVRAGGPQRERHQCGDSSMRRCRTRAAAGMPLSWSATARFAV